MNKISKKRKIEIDTISQNLLRPKDFTFVVGDSVDIECTIKEEGISKDITGCSLRLIGVSTLGSIEQSEYIEIIDEVNGKIKIHLDENKFNIEGTIQCCVVISDLDETIYPQKFMVRYIANPEVNIIEQAVERIETLRKLNGLIDNYIEDLSTIKIKVEDTISLVKNKHIEIIEEYNQAKETIDDELAGIENRINSVSNTVNFELVKPLKLIPNRIAGSNYVYMTTGEVDLTPYDLLNRSYLVYLGGIVESGNYNTATGILTFYKQGTKIYPNYLSLSDRNINNKTLSPSVVFGDLTSEISIAAASVILMVKSNILKTLNTDMDVICRLTPLGIQ